MMHRLLALSAMLATAVPALADVAMTSAAPAPTLSLPTGDDVRIRARLMGWGAAPAGPPVIHDIAEEATEPRRAVRMPISSGFGMRFHPIARIYRAHRGIDIPGPRGAPIRAVEDGVVVRAGWAGGYGNLVEIDHGGGLTTRYGHLDWIAVPSGTRIGRGALVGHMGTTGRSTGTHLHFEVRDRGAAIDPIAYLSTGTRSYVSGPIVETATSISQFAKLRPSPAGLKERVSP